MAVNVDSKASINGAFTGSALNLVVSFQGVEMTSSMMAAKIAAHGVVGGLSAQSQGGSFESGFLTVDLSQSAGKFHVHENLGAWEGLFNEEL